MQTSDNRPRDLVRAMRRGFFGRCPKCGIGKMFGRFLRINEHCAVCREALYHYDAAYSAELTPAFLVQSVVSLPVGMGVLYFSSYSVSPDWVNMAIWTVVTLGLSMTTLQATKGAIVGLQWANRLEGFR